MTTRQVLGPIVPMLRAAELSSLEGRPAAIGAFNVNFYSQAEGILEGLRRAEAPGILQASRGANKFQGGPENIAEMVLAAVRKSGHSLPVCLHLDHGDEPAARECIDRGFGSVMLDVSKLEYDANIAAVRNVVQLAHPKGISVEAELGHLAGVEEDVSSATTTYADPYLVPNFFDKSGCDSLAIAYGTSHGPDKGAGLEKLAVHIVEKCYRGMAAFGQNESRFLVSHGSSTVPQELVKEINSFGGKMKDARGIPMDRIQAAIGAGIRKINIDTDLRLGITATFRRYLAEHPGVERGSAELAGIWKALDGSPAAVDPRDYLGHIGRALLRRDPRGTALEEPMRLVRERVAAHVERLCREFGSAGLAPRVEGHSFDTMASVYLR
ncbi:MAG: fructose-bisphosphate aldolase [Euryarchaeota archaeon]|nr:fructose-bisphosphate aldolase [Euryarchaeota archaeon]